jgi:hypothetical protein
MKLRHLFLLVAASAVFPARAHAFDYAAHCRMSNRALRLAAIRVQRALPPGDPRHDSLGVLRRVSRESACLESRRTRTFAYGEWVAQVDWATSPADFFVTPVEGAANTWAWSDTVPVDAIHAMANLPLQDFRVLHENSEHFGATALYSFQLWHRFAIDQARAGNLNTALVYQAFADHYLEDLFAPGHVFSPRRGLNDVLAGGIHNRYNREGAYYRPEHTGELAVYLADTTGVGDELLPDFGSVAQGCFRRLRRDGRPAGGEPSGLRACVDALEGGEIAMYGDNQLERSPEQELYVTLVIARSVDDVLQAWVDGPGAAPGRDSFAGARWCGYDMPPSSGSGRRWTSPDVVLPFGRYYREEHSGLPLFDRWPAVRAGYVNRIGKSGGSVELSTEWISRAWLATWTGAVNPGKTRRTRVFREDRTTYTGIDARIPVGSGGHGWAVGAYRRGSASLNRVNLRTSYVFGARVLPGDRSVEPHVGVGGEVGFSVLHLEVRPSAAYNTRHGMEFGVLSGLSVVVPLPGKHRPPPGTRPVFPNPVAQPCR